MHDTFCPCCSGKYYAYCCKPFHEGEIPKNALELMRSRYSAYALNFPEYIISTTHPGSTNFSENFFSWKRKISNFSKNSQFNGLKILEFQEQGPVAVVTFHAEVSRENEDVSFIERSIFEKFHERWLYRSGYFFEKNFPHYLQKKPFKGLPLAYYGDPILTQKAEPIEEINAEIKDLVEGMIDTMRACNGIGIAAPQVHHSKRIFIVCANADEEQDELEEPKIKVLINPKLINPSKETWNAEEGCLSIPTIHADIERPKEITVEYLTLEGLKVSERLKGWDARVAMHENDHLNGVLLVNRINKDAREILDPKLNTLKKRIHN